MLKTLTLILILAVGAFAQAFSREWTTVPPAFVPDDGKQIISALTLSPALKDKDEFETTAEYEQRRSDPKRTLLGKGKTAADMLVFTVDGGPMAGLGALNASYDADRQIMTVSLDVQQFDHYPDIDDGSLRKVIISGIRFPGMETSEKREGLRLVKYIRWYGMGISNFAELVGPNIKYEMQLAPAQAREVKPNLAALFVAKLIPPYRGISVISSKPTLERPYETTFATFFLFTVVSEIWIYNSKSGEIYNKFKAGDPVKADILQ